MTPTTTTRDTAIGVRNLRATLRHAPAPGCSFHQPRTNRPESMLQDLAPKSGAHYDASRPIAFMHVPKTSGIAVREGLQSCTHTQGPPPGFDRSAFGDFAGFDTVDRMLMRDIYLDGKLPQLSASFVTGHISASTLSAHRAGAQLVTILREPRSRLLSHWLFWRGLTDDQLRPWGKWADCVRAAYKPLAEFLSDPHVASNTDNMTVRMLLWPHPDIPGGDFIDRRADEQLVSAALARLDAFAFVDLVENPQVAANLQAWLGRPFIYGRTNETAVLPAALRSPLAEELTQDVFDLLDVRSRLDRQVWLALARHRIPHMDAEALAERTIIRNVARHSMLMAG
jgi:hypothetical protein